MTLVFKKKKILKIIVYISFKWHLQMLAIYIRNNNSLYNIKIKSTKKLYINNYKGHDVWLLYIKPKL